MARRFVRSWFSNELEEINDDSPGGRQIIARGETHGMPEGRHGAAYNKPWQSEALGVPLSQMADFNEAAQKAGTGARYVPSRDKSFAVCECDSRSSRAREMQLRGVFDKDAGYRDYTGSF